jgi:hypothetical protein
MDRGTWICMLAHSVILTLKIPFSLIILLNSGLTLAFDTNMK